MADIPYKPKLATSHLEVLRPRGVVGLPYGHEPGQAQVRAALPHMPRQRAGLVRLHAVLALLAACVHLSAVV